MEITVLTDNRTNGKCIAEHGLSLFIQTDSNIKILFDTGASDLFLRNADILGVDISSADILVLSHGHWDHGNGLGFIKGKSLLCHPDCFIKRYRKRDNTYIGLKYSQEEIETNYDLILSKRSYKISDDVFFLGEIPRINSFESKETPFISEENRDDFVIDDSGIAITSQKGLIVISGCAHSGICNTIEHAKRITNINNIYAVLGGFHLKKIDNTSRKTIDYLKENNIKKVFPCHCVESSVIEFFAKHFPNETLSAGVSINL